MTGASALQRNTPVRKALPQELGYAEFNDTSEFQANAALTTNPGGGVTIPGTILGVTVGSRAIIVEAGGTKVHSGTAGVNGYVAIKDQSNAVLAATGGASYAAGAWVPVATIRKRLKLAPGDYVFRLVLGSDTGALAGIQQTAGAPAAWLRIFEV